MSIFTLILGTIGGIYLGVVKAEKIREIYHSLTGK